MGAAKYLQSLGRDFVVYNSSLYIYKYLTAFINAYEVGDTRP